MAVMAAGRNQPVEQLGEILFEPRLKLDDSHGARAANVEDVGDAGLDP